MNSRILDLTLFASERVRVALLALALIGLIKSAFFVLGQPPSQRGAERVVVPISAWTPAPEPA